MPIPPHRRSTVRVTPHAPRRGRARTLRAGGTALVATLTLALGACGGSGSGGAEADRPGTTRTSGAGTADRVPARPSAGCGTSTVRAGQERVTIESGGQERWFLRHVPPAHDGRTPVPLVLDFHGYSEGAEVHTQMSKLGEFGDTEGFVTLFPQGTGPVPRWDFGLDPGSADVTFARDLLELAGRTLCIDEARVYVTGLSNGAFFTSILACVLADRIAAVAPVAGVRAIDGCDPARPVPVVAFHGTADTFVTFDGSPGTGASRLPAPDGSGRTLGELGGDRAPVLGTPVPEHLRRWAQRNGCRTEPRERRVADDVTRVAWPCPDGAEVLLYRIEGGGHSWPGSEFSAGIEGIVGRTTMSISANEVMWEFFQAHPLRRPR